MKNPIKSMCVALAAALVMAAGMNCAPAASQTARPAPAPARATAPSPAPAPAQAPSSGSNTPQTYTPATNVSSNTTAAPKAKTPTADDELDIAIRDASDYLNDNIPNGSKIVILNIESNSANLSEYVIDELIANAVNDKKFSVVDRRQLEAIQSEQKFQMSGAVDDKDALAIGKFFGAQTIISGAMREIGARYRLTIRALSVQTAQVQGQYNRNMAASDMLIDIANSSGSRPAGSAAYGTSGRTTQTTSAATTTAKPTTPAEPLIQGIMVPGESLTEKLEWLKKSADSHNTYILEVNADESIAPHTFEFSGGINITVVLRGVGGNRTIRLRSNGTMFTVSKNVTFILDNNITLMGHSGNNGCMVHVQDGTFKMNASSAITGNDYEYDGGGVRVGNRFGSGKFEMNGGTISGNSARNGGGVYVGRKSSFIMTNGTITGNKGGRGGGVYVENEFVNGTNDNGTFIMKGGTITSNIANEFGGGVYCAGYDTFTKTGGTITGYSSDQNNGNVVKDDGGDILARNGHAVNAYQQKRKETTSGPKANMSVGNYFKSHTGAWDQ